MTNYNDSYKAVRVDYSGTSDADQVRGPALAAEQKLHLARQRLHECLLHVPGVLDGLQLRIEATSLVVCAGVALGPTGDPIFVPEVPQPARAGRVVVSFKESESESGPVGGLLAYAPRYTLDILPESAVDPTIHVVLGDVVARGNKLDVSLASRQHAGVRLSGAALRTTGDGAVRLDGAALHVPGALRVGQDANEIDVAQAIAQKLDRSGGSVPGSLDVAQEVKAGSLSTSGKLTAAEVTVVGSMTVESSATIKGNLDVAGNATFPGLSLKPNAVKVNAEFSANRATFDGRILAKAGIETADGQSLDVHGNIDVDGSVTVRGDLKCGNNLQVKDRLVRTGVPVEIENTLTASGLVTAKAGVKSDGVITANDVINANAGVKVPSGQQLVVQGKIVASGGLAVEGTLPFELGVLLKAKSADFTDTLRTETLESRRANVGSLEASTVSATRVTLTEQMTAPKVVVQESLTSRNITVDETLTVNRKLDVRGDVAVTGQLVCGALTVSQAKLETTARIDAQGGITVSNQPLNVHSMLNANGGLQAGNVTVTGAAAVTGTLTAAGQTTLTGEVHATSGMTVSGTVFLAKSGARFEGPAIVAAAGITVPADQKLKVEGSLIARDIDVGKIVVHGDAAFEGALTARGGLQAAGDAVFTGLVTMQRTLTANDIRVSSSGTLRAEGKVEASAGLSVSRGLLNASGGAAIQGGLTVIGPTTTQGLTVEGPLQAKAGVTVDGALTVKNNLSVATIYATRTIQAGDGVLIPADKALSCGQFKWAGNNVSLGLNTGSVDAIRLNTGGVITLQHASGAGTTALDVDGHIHLRASITNRAPGILFGRTSLTQPSSGSPIESPCAGYVGMVGHYAVGFSAVPPSFTGREQPSGSLLRVFTADGTLSINGQAAYKATPGPWAGPSDERLKTEITDLGGALDRLLKLRGVYFEWREPKKRGTKEGRQIGLIAQEVEEVFPEWISEGEDGYKLLSVSGFEALTIEALRQLHQEIRELRGEAPVELPPRASPPTQDTGTGERPREEAPSRPAPAPRQHVATYTYTDESGQLLYEVLRYAPKAFIHRRPDGEGGWIEDLTGVRLVPYHLPAVLAAESVFITEGEKDVASAEQLGLPNATWAATTSPGPAQWRSEYGEYLRGKRVVICPDTDRAGQGYFRQIVAELAGKASEVRWLKLPEGTKDLSEWVEAGGTSAQFAAMLRAAPVVDPRHLP